MTNKDIQSASKKWFQGGSALVHAIAKEHAKRGLLLVRKEIHLEDFVGSNVGKVQFHLYTPSEENASTIIVRPNYTGYKSADTFLKEWEELAEYNSKLERRLSEAWKLREEWMSRSQVYTEEDIKERKDEWIAYFKKQEYKPPHKFPQSPIKVLGELVAEITIPRLAWNFDSSQKEGYFVERCPREKLLILSDENERRQRIVSFHFHEFDEYFLVGEMANVQQLETIINNPRLLRSDKKLFTILKEYEGEEKQLRIPHYG